MGALIHRRPRLILGGPAASITGLGGLNVNGGTLMPLPEWVRGGTEGGFAGWFTMTSSTIDNLSRLFQFSNATDTEVFQCFIEPASNRWQAQMKTNSIDRTVIYVLGAPPTIGQTVGFAVTWRDNRIAMAIGSNVMEASAYDIPFATFAPADRFILGNRGDGLRPLPATWRALEWFDHYIPDAALSGLAQRPLPVTP
jgi:hypothetical protein